MAVTFFFKLELAIPQMPLTLSLLGFLCIASR